MRDKHGSDALGFGRLSFRKPLACGVFLSPRWGLPPAARFLLRERNRGKSAAGVFPCTPGAQGAEAKGAKARRGRSGC